MVSLAARLTSSARRFAARNLLRSFCLLSLVVPLCGCTSLRDYVHNGLKVGPNYGRPQAPVAEKWIEAADKRMRKESDDLSKWWTVLNDPVLDKLICFAYQENLTLRRRASGCSRRGHS